MPSPSFLILAAGQGTRMKSSKPKALLELSGKSFLGHILDRLGELKVEANVGIVIGHEGAQIENWLSSYATPQNLQITFIEQKVRRGTGDAVRIALESDWGKKVVRGKNPLAILSGDVPLLSTELLNALVEPLPKNTVGRVVTCEMKKPAGLGRIIRNKAGKFLKITEDKDATAIEKKIREINSGIYFFDMDFASKNICKLKNQNAQNEYYLTDLVAIALKNKKNIAPLLWLDPEDVMGINDPWELSIAQSIYNQRILKKFARQGVVIQNPTNTFISSEAEIEAGVEISSGVQIFGNTRIGRQSTIGPQSLLKNVQVGEKCNIKQGVVAEESVIEDEASVGPYAHLRPESHVGRKSKIGNFVELKKTKIGPSTSVAHLSYLGDAVVGANVNIGCGFVTCNFDGRVINGERKHRTIIEDDAFIGSDCQAVAPVKIGQGAYIASGSTINQDVPAGDLAIARSKQVNKPGYAKRLRRS